MIRFGDVRLDVGFAELSEVVNDQVDSNVVGVVENSAVHQTQQCRHEVIMNVDHLPGDMTVPSSNRAWFAVLALRELLDNPDRTDWDELLAANRALIKATATDRPSGGQPPGAPSPDGCRSLPRTAGRLLMATGQPCDRHG
jgi:hypothetical protein